MIEEYVTAALRHADYKRLADDTWFASVPGLEGAWANAATVEGCRGELREVLESWLVLKLRDDDEIPTIDGVEIPRREEAVV